MANRTDIVNIFPPSSTCLLVGASLSGKSSLIKYLIKNHCYFFTQPIEQFIVVYCNLQSKFLFEEDALENINLVQIYLSEFDTNLLTENTLLIFEDVHNSHPFIKSSIHTYSHHSQLTATFVLCQSISGSLSELIGLVHKIIFLTKAKTVAKDFKHIIQKFVTTEELKQYLYTLYHYVEASSSSLLLELYSHSYKDFSPVAYSHLEFLLNGDCKIYLGPQDINMETFGNDVSTLRPLDSSTSEAEGRNDLLPKNTMIVLPIEFVSSFKNTNDIESPCKSKEIWMDIVNDIEDDIDTFINIKKRTSAKLLLSKILQSNVFCLTTPDKFLYLKKKPTHKVSILDFITFVTRPKGPKEILQPHQYIFNEMKQVLLQKGTPPFLFKNALLDVKANK